jgi:DNA repair ATPase RecN
LDKLVTEQVKAIESVVTEGFRSIFFDQHLSLLAEVGQARGKISIDLLIRDSSGPSEIVGPPLETFGGGPSTIASLTLRILALLRLKKFPLLLLDETLAAISAEYVEPTGKFLRKLAESTGIPILLVTHNHGFLDHAKVAYRVDGASTDTTKTIRITKIAGP